MSVALGDVVGVVVGRNEDLGTRLGAERRRYRLRGRSLVLTVDRERDGGSPFAGASKPRTQLTGDADRRNRTRTVAGTNVACRG
ncbi:hypothetical protein D8S78_20340 [Natrialba swarupiae]|nr:hypothetical protein [Natrialba swarupiae]